ncbi:MAG: hypothetical protein M1826_006066 [Phylliscum demangeonii]|nr:MAG: hypothetical protein M1826_006066 [Phylliscum demangeonii]
MMRVSRFLVALIGLVPRVLSTASSKRGLVYVTSAHNAQDDSTWTQDGSDLTWYYNYASKPTASLSGSHLQFVPMLFAASSNTQDTAFTDDVRALIKAGTNVSAVLTFNEPDGTQATGGSSIQPELAAATWIREVEPLKKDGVQLGAPAVTGSPGGFTWLDAFFSACNGQCHPDFIPVHWYGNFDGLASHLGQVHSTYANMSIWVTEYALAHEQLAPSQSFSSMSAEYFDRLDYVDRYSYFGSFRSSVSNVGPNAAMLTQDGKITDLGAAYVNVPPQGNVPKGAGHVSRPPLLLQAFSLSLVLVGWLWML